jgi:hypothetical protein
VVYFNVLSLHSNKEAEERCESRQSVELADRWTLEMGTTGYKYTKLLSLIAGRRH